MVGRQPYLLRGGKRIGLGMTADSVVAGGVAEGF